MLTETETKETIGFVVIISIICGISIGAEPPSNPPPLSPGYAYERLCSIRLCEIINSKHPVE